MLLMGTSRMTATQLTSASDSTPQKELSKSSVFWGVIVMMKFYPHMYYVTRIGSEKNS